MMTLRLCSLSLLAGAWSLAAGASLDEGLRLKQERQLPQAEAAFTTVITAEPGNHRALAERATVRGWQQHYDEAIADWRAAIALQPQDADYHTGLARVLWWKGDRTGALDALDRGLLLRPRDAEMWELKGDIARADGNRALAITAYREADRIDQGSRLGERLGKIEGPDQSWRIDVGGVRDSYSQTRPIEALGYASVAYADRPGDDGGPLWTARLGTNVEHRFEAIDATIEGEGSYRYMEGLRLIARGGFTPSADFTYDWTLGAGVVVSPVRPLGLLLDVDHQQYNASEQQVLRVSPGIAWDFWRLSTELRYRAVVQHVPGTTDTGDSGSIRVTLDLGRFHPSLSYLQGREPDPPFAITDVRAIWGGVVFDIDRNLSLRIDGAFEHRDAQYDRTSVGGGVILRF
jgi:YaiO family outer membrane protein